MARAETEAEDRVNRWWRRIVESPHTRWMFAVASFLETLILPIPIEAILVPYMLCRRDRIWRTATVVLAGCLVAALVGYGFGYFLFDTVGQWFLDAMQYNRQFEAFRERFEQQGFWAIVLVGIVPIPFQLAILAAGISGYSVPLFLLGAAIARGLRYYGLALVLWLFGDAAIRLWQRLPNASITAAGAAAAAAGIWLIASYVV